VEVVVEKRVRQDVQPAEIGQIVHEIQQAIPFFIAKDHPPLNDS
jgi:hypothetical protein